MRKIELMNQMIYVVAVNDAIVTLYVINVPIKLSEIVQKEISTSVPKIS